MLGREPVLLGLFGGKSGRAIERDFDVVSVNPNIDLAPVVDDASHLETAASIVDDEACFANAPIGARLRKLDCDGGRREPSIGIVIGDRAFEHFGRR